MGQESPIPSNGNGFVCNLYCNGGGPFAPLEASFTHTSTTCPASVGTPYYVSHTVYYGSRAPGWTASSTIQSAVITP